MKVWVGISGHSHQRSVIRKDRNQKEMEGSGGVLITDRWIRDTKP